MAAPTTVTRKSNGGFYISVTCPGCGGDLQFEDDYFVTRCTHCGSGHRIILPDVPPAYVVQPRVTEREARFAVDRYLKAQGLPLTSSNLLTKQFLYPYWKVDAVLLKIRNRTETRYVVEDSENTQESSYQQDRTDINLSPYCTTIDSGPVWDGVPATLGMRAEYIKMMPYAEQYIPDEFSVMPLARGWESARTQIQRRVSAVGSIEVAGFGKNVTELFFPKLSVVYFPYILFESLSDDGMSRCIVDGVTGNVASHVTQLSAGTSELEDPPQFEYGAVTVEPHRCRECGEDLPTTPSHVYVCRNCQTLTCLGGGGVDIGTIRVTTNTGNPKDILVPFWALGISEDQQKYLRTVFGGLFASDTLVIPAFKASNFDAMFRLAKRISAAVPRLDLCPAENWDPRLMPVTLPVNDALMYAEIFIEKDRYVKGARRDNTRPFAPQDIFLFYVPFHAENYFYVDSVLNAISVEKTLLGGR